MSKWISEEVWLEAMKVEDSRIRHLSEHAWYNERGVLDTSYKAQLIHEAQRHGRRSTIVTSQLPVDRWHDLIGDPTYADAILDRLVHTAHRIALDGDSLRKARTRGGIPKTP